MKKNTSSQQKLKEILAHQKYEDLEPYQQTATWKALNAEDRRSLASLFVLRGEKQLEQSDKKGIESFKIAARITPNDLHLFYRMGCAYAGHKDNNASLKLAEEAFLTALALDKYHVGSQRLLGEVYTCLGNIEDDELYYEKAECCFAEALLNLSDDNKEERSHLLWLWGMVWFSSGKKSGEANDYIKAFDKFCHAGNLGLQTQHFWLNYGHLFMQLAQLLNKTELYIEAIECYRQGIKQSFDFFEGWLSLAYSYQCLFELSLSEDYFNQADECFKMASQLKESSSQLYLNWGTLLYLGGKYFQDAELISESSSKFERAYALEPDETAILCKWAQALMFYGVHNDNLNKIQEARQKILQGLQKDPDSVDCWYYYGLCLIELGRYFNDEEYFYKAIDKFRQGLTFNESDFYLFYGLAISYFAIGDINSEIEMLEKSVSFFVKASEQDKKPSRQFWNDWGVVLMKLAEMTHDKNHVFSALEKFDKALEDNVLDSFGKVIDPEWLYNYGCAWDFLGDFQEDADCYDHAIAALSKVLETDPTYSHARYNLALAYAHLGELCMDVESFHKSIEHFQILLNQDSEDEMGWNDYGITLMHLSKLIQDKTSSDYSLALYELAESKLLHSAALGNIQSYYNLACLYSLMNKHSYAMHFLEKAEEAEALPVLKEILEDEWLENLRVTQAFRNFVAQLPPSQKQLPEEEG